MPELTSKQRYWAQQLKLADSFDGSMSQYATAENIPAKKLYRWRNYFRKSSAVKDNATPVFTKVVNSSVPECCLKLTVGSMQLEFARLPNPQWLAEFIAQSNVS